LSCCFAIPKRRTRSCFRCQPEVDQSPCTQGSRIGGLAIRRGTVPDDVVRWLGILFDRMPAGIAAFGPEHSLLYCNQDWAHSVSQRLFVPKERITQGALVAELLPGSEAVLAALLGRVLAGESACVDAVSLESWSEAQEDTLVSYWDVAATPVGWCGQVVAALVLMHDVTERVEAHLALEQQAADRVRELSALRDVMTAVGASLDLRAIIERALERVLAVIYADVGAIHLVDEAGGPLHLAAVLGVPPGQVGGMSTEVARDGLAGWVVEHGEPLLVPNLADSPRPLLSLPATGSQTYLGVPIRAKGRTLGVISIVGEPGRRFSTGEVSLLATVADQVGVAIENAQLYRQAEHLAVMRERQRLARELHDSVTQSLYSLTLLAEAGRRLASAGELERVEEAVTRLGEIGHHALKEMRLLVYELRPLALQREGLVSAIQQRLDAVERRAGVEAALEVAGTIRLPEPVEEELYRIVQEALNNALKHSGATAVTVRIATGPERTEIEIADNGRGFDPEAVSRDRGMGLVGMQERAEKLGGSLAVQSAPGQGTRVTAWVTGHQP